MDEGTMKRLLSVLLLSLGVPRGSPGGETNAHELVVPGGFAYLGVGRDGTRIYVVWADLHGHYCHSCPRRALTRQQQPKV